MRWRALFAAATVAAAATPPPSTAAARRRRGRRRPRDRRRRRRRRHRRLAASAVLAAARRNHSNWQRHLRAACSLPAARPGSAACAHASVESAGAPPSAARGRRPDAYPAAAGRHHTRNPAVTASLWRALRRQWPGACWVLDAPATDAGRVPLDVGEAHLVLDLLAHEDEQPPRAGAPSSTRRRPPRVSRRGL